MKRSSLARSITLFTLSLLLLAGTQLSWATEISPKAVSKAINVAGRQRMLTQRMTKLVLMVALGKKVDKARSQLKQALTLYTDSQNNLLNGNAGENIPAPIDSAVKAKYQQLGQAWSAFKAEIEPALTQDKFSDSALATLYSSNLRMLKENNKAVQLYVAAAKKLSIPVAGQTVNVAGRQRMLSQKIAKATFFFILGVNKSDSQAEAKAAVKLFADSLQHLIQGDAAQGIKPTTDAMTLAKMQQVEKDWAKYKKYIEASIGVGRVSKRMVVRINKLSDKLLKGMNTAVSLYEKISA